MIKEFASIFLQHDLDLWQDIIHKHKIKLMAETPFKEHYRHIPPGFYEEVENLLKEILNISAIRPSSSPWTSEMVLV